ncbi:hypothetical protein HG530_008545 [Fusarium avenaceum]|nr:hypothetical protein HG530_008545 [Fusarium avenaceum]KIL85342.1 hypothetical protein FAVG1_11298 [Fusarium avenaceum]
MLEGPNTLPRARSGASGVIVTDSGDERLQTMDDNSEDEHPQPRSPWKYEAEFGMVLRASSNLAKTVHRAYNPFLADYACTLYAWQTNETCGRLMKLELPTGFWNEKPLGRKASRKMEGLQHRSQTRILTLRKKCIAEGLSKDVTAIDVEMGITESMLETWTEEESSRQRSSQRLVLEDLEWPTDQKRDRLTRLNEWLLQMRDSHEYLAQLHRSFWYSGHTARDVAKSAPFPEDWDRVTLKYWFLDTAAMVTEDYATSSQGGGDSEATFKPNCDDNDLCDRPYKNFDEPLGYTQFMILQPDYPPVALGRGNVSDISLQHYIHSPRDGLDPEIAVAARDILLMYTQEPAGAGSVEISPEQKLVIEARTKS